MKITSVQYGRVVNLGNYENERISAWANVEDHEEPDETLRILTQWVETMAAARKEQETTLRKAEVDILNLEAQRSTMAYEVDQMRKTWTKAYEFLKAVGLELPRAYAQAHDDAEMPF